MDLSDDELDKIKDRLHELELEHRDLDVAISQLQESAGHNQLSIQRMKKRKLVLKDMIHRYHSMLIPDEPA